MKMGKNSIQNVLEGLRGHILYPSDTVGYIVVFYTGLPMTIVLGEDKNVLMFDIIGPIGEPDRLVVQVANIIDSFNLPAYNIQVAHGILSAEAKYKVIADLKVFKETTHERVAKWKLSQNLNDALGL